MKYHFTFSNLTTIKLSGIILNYVAGNQLYA